MLGMDLICTRECGPLGLRVLAFSGAREWRNRQTRTVQVRVPERAWGFNSPLAHICKEEMLDAVHYVRLTLVSGARVRLTLPPRLENSQFFVRATFR